MKFQKEIKFLIENEGFEKKRKKISSQQIERIKSFYPNAPTDYLDFLTEIGAGQFKNSQYEFKSFLFDLSDIGLNGIYEIPPNIVFFGDNLIGDFVGFDLSSEKETVVKLNHESGMIINTKLSFCDFFRMQIGLQQ